MLHTVPSKYGEPGDLLLRTPGGILRFASLARPDTSIDPRGVWSCGLQLPEDDIQAVEDVLRDAFRAAYPSTTGTVILPIRADRTGTRHLFAKSTIQPAILDADGMPAKSITNGNRVVLMVRACPWSRQGRNGVSVFLSGVCCVRHGTDDPGPAHEAILTHPLARTQGITSTNLTR